MQLKDLRRIWRVQTGDTIVEVLIAIAVVSLVLGGAFVATNRSLNATRDAQEHGDALKLVESQIEQIKSLAVSDPDEIFGATPASFCINQTGDVVAAGGTACRFNASGTTPAAGEPAYDLAVSKATNTFTVGSTWTTTRGNAAAVQLKYKVYR